ncbi:MAG: leucyl aminopeptidase family protein [Gammaproteobacteria bacterium]|nr:leucyl aminopeptidase family protein [Gammaproteobacteria bacterium]
MTEIVPELHDIRIFQKVGRLDNRTLDTVDQLLLILPARPTAAHFRRIPQGNKLQAVMRKHAAGSTPAFSSRLNNKKQTLVVGGKQSADASTFEQLTFGRKLVTAAMTQKPGSLGICAIGFSTEEQARIVNNVLSAALAAGFTLPSYKSEKTPSRINSIRLLGLDQALDTSRTEAEAKGNNLARWLTTQPPNLLNATSYTSLVRRMAKERGWHFKRFATRELESLGAGAFLAVAQGNEDDSACIIRLSYRPANSGEKVDLSLVGKGIIFDTGGTNLKPFQPMLDMHGDMQGSAVALGTFLTISELNVPIAVDCWLAVTENRIGPRAYKSQDVVTAANGKTIQTVHTDAEGRMVLADTLVLASREKPALLFDFATLTGACQTAITKRYSGVFTNDVGLHQRLTDTGTRSGERVWPFPIGKEFLSDLASATADILQCSPKASGDHILAASFLAEFVDDDTPWVHMDLSAAENENGLGHVGSKFTGFGVRYTLSIVLDENLLKAPD